MREVGLRVSGSILIYRLYDVAWDINPMKVEEKVRDYRRHSIDRKRFSKAFEFANPPLSLKLKTLDCWWLALPREKKPLPELCTCDIFLKCVEYIQLFSRLELVMATH